VGALPTAICNKKPLGILGVLWLVVL